MGIELSIVIPVFNEAAIVTDSVLGLLDRLPSISDNFEIILAENGSTDGTINKVLELEERHSQVRHIHVEEPNYGRALKEGIFSALGTYVICDEIDLCDTDFYRSSLGLLRTGRAEMVIGSKLAPGSRDDRPWVRHLGTQVLNGMLRWGLGFKGTDTHGLKAFKRELFLDVIKACLVEDNIFTSEFVIRAERTGRQIVDLPLNVREKRTPTINLFRRIPRALWNVGRLIWVIRIQGRRRESSLKNPEERNQPPN